MAAAIRERHTLFSLSLIYHRAPVARLGLDHSVVSARPFVPQPRTGQAWSSAVGASHVVCVCAHACVRACVWGDGDWGLGSTLVWYGLGWCDVEVDATGVEGTAGRWSRYRTVYRVSLVPTLHRLFKVINVTRQARQVGRGSRGTGHWHWHWHWHWLSVPNRAGVAQH